MLPALYLLLAPLAAVPADDDPPVRVWLRTDGVYQPGDRVRVYVATADDGYLVVLRTDGSGRVRVLFPLDPDDDDYVRGGRDFELRGRGDRDAFFVDDREGTGIVLAAWSRDPFRFDEFVRGDHWDYRTLGPVADDPEAGLLDIVHRMAVGARFEYDDVRYSVSGVAASYYGGHVPYGFGVTMSFGYPSYGFFGYPYYRYYGATGCYGPAFYGPWGMCPYGSYWFSRGGAFFFDVPYPFGYGYPGRTYYSSSLGRPGSGSPGFLVPRQREVVQPVEPRRRVAVAEPRRRVAAAPEPRGRAPEEPRRWHEPRGDAHEPRGGAYEPRGGPAAPPRGGEARPSNPEPRRSPAPARAGVPVKVRQ